jgi:hypothetical protein
MKSVSIDSRLANIDPAVAELLREMAEAINSIGPRVVTCFGTPEGAVVGRRGQIALRLDGGSTTTLYVKTSGDGTNTGWTAK